MGLTTMGPGPAPRLCVGSPSPPRAPGPADIVDTGSSGRLLSEDLPQASMKRSNVMGGGSPLGPANGDTNIQEKRTGAPRKRGTKVPNTVGVGQ